MDSLQRETLSNDTDIKGGRIRDWEEGRIVGVGEKEERTHTHSHICEGTHTKYPVKYIIFTTHKERAFSVM